MQDPKTFRKSVERTTLFLTTGTSFLAGFGVWTGLFLSITADDQYEAMAGALLMIVSGLLIIACHLIWRDEQRRLDNLRWFLPTHDNSMRPIQPKSPNRTKEV